jgi:acetylglutamate kinase
MQTLNIIKAGGAILEDPEKLKVFLQSFSELKGNKLLVHGGGREATELGNRLGLEAKMNQGRRITDDKYIDIVTMTYGGLINKRLVAKLQSLGANALGLTGADGNLIQSKKRPVVNGIDYGWVGDPERVNTQLISSLIENGIVPVCAPLTHDGSGHLLNTNADTIASILSTALSPLFEVHLIFAFELSGVLRDVDNPESLIQKINPSTYQQLKESKQIFDGMIPKLDNAFAAISEGVRSVKIINYNAIGNLSDPTFDTFTQIEG